MGLVNSPVPCGQVLDAALRLAYELAAFPQRCVRSDRLSAYEQWSLLTRRRSATSSAVAPTSPNRARPTLVGTPSGYVTGSLHDEREVYYQAEKAKGGVGLQFMGATNVIRAQRSQPTIS